MKRYSIFFFLLNFMMQYEVIAQNLETVFSNGYGTHISDFDRFSNGRWLIAYVDSPIPGAIYEDTIVVRILDSTVIHNHQIIISPFVSFENYSIEKCMTLPHDEFLICYSGGDCDAGGYSFFIEKFDSLAQSVWHIQMPEDFRPRTFAIGLDSNILLIDRDQVAKLSSSNGVVLWQIEYSEYYPDDAIVEPGTENIITTEHPGLKYYIQKITNGEISYSIKASKDLNLVYSHVTYLIGGHNGIFYAQKFPSREILKFRNDLESQVILIGDQRKFDMSSTSEGFAILNRSGFNHYDIILYDTTGQVLKGYQSTESGLRPRIIKCFPEGIGLAGEYSTGPPSTYNPDYLFVGRNQGWFRYFHEYSFLDYSAEPSMALTEIIQQDSITYDTSWTDGSYSGYIYDFFGGDFKLKFTNTGIETIHSFWVNIAFGTVQNVWFCNPYLAIQRLIDNISLKPGESMWYEFGDIDAYRQMDIPDQFCFWTSGPNKLPDYIPQDDVHCSDRIVSTLPVSENSFSLFPNPANSEITISWSGEKFSTIHWKLIDVNGRIVKKGHAESNVGKGTIEVTNLPSGIYYFSAGHFSKTIIILHSSS